MRITVETIIKAPVDKVWSAYATPDDIKQIAIASCTPSVQVRLLWKRGIMTP